MREATYSLIDRHAALARHCERIEGWLPYIGWMRQRVSRWLDPRRQKQDALFSEIKIRFEAVVSVLWLENDDDGVNRRDRALKWVLLVPCLQNKLLRGTGDSVFIDHLWSCALKSSHLAGRSDELVKWHRRRFHLLALLDEIPSSDGRGMVRTWAFEPAAAAANQHDLTKETRQLIDLGCQELATWLLPNKDRLATLTNKCIQAHDLENKPDLSATIRSWLFKE